MESNLCGLATDSHVNEVRAFTCYVNISINKLLTEPVYICFVNKDQRQKEWTGRSENLSAC